MATMHAGSWGLTVTSDTGLIGEAPSRASRRRVSRWRVLKSLAYGAALASAMTDPQIAAMLVQDRVERERDGR